MTYSLSVQDVLRSLVEHARGNSPFYKELYAELPADWTLADLPIIDQASFWAANTLQDNQVMTGPHTNGIVFKTGGTTNAPRVSWYSRDEWRSMGEVFATGLHAAGVRDGDRVANLYYAGELYSGFIFTMNTLELVNTVQLPIAGGAPLDFTLQTLQDFHATVVAAFPTSLVRLAEYVLDNAGALPEVRLVLFSGEAFYGDQRAVVERAFPNADIRSIGYASVDGGILGSSVVDSDDPRVFRAFRPTRLLEIVDVDTNEPIEVPGRPGKLLVTDLSRKLMPMIRYPVGDLAEWVSFEEGTFRLLGRSDEGARCGPVTLHLDYLRSVVAETVRSFTGFQVVLRRVDAKDQLVLRVAGAAGNRELLEQAISAGVDRISPRFADHVRRGVINPLVVEWVEALQANPRTGKTIRLIDERPVS
ncbi:phenylacetate-coenzyme A ligase [Lentzea sp. NBRC 105346]|uniref:phenylacetate--CoA ligase family protein n=1 Tax=Lentzea sp. NBRC 105346 TaxID=3032205 RepID=UPI00249F9DB5|nr:phenylacetate--CoA ligase family protein [Lentzea sp. NBRC 105346]GLZ30015.1 phenylacetate-coenzyme A ligase [Lentzea sp. NBRC 105346]